MSQHNSGLETCRLCESVIPKKASKILNFGTTFADDTETYRQFRSALIMATDAIEQIAENFTHLAFNDEREQEINEQFAEAMDNLDFAARVRHQWFNARVAIAEGGEA